LYAAAALLAVCGVVLLTWQWLTGLIAPARIAQPFRLVGRFDTSEICITCPLLFLVLALPGSMLHWDDKSITLSLTCI